MPLYIRKFQTFLSPNKSVRLWRSGARKQLSNRANCIYFVRKTYKDSDCLVSWMSVFTLTPDHRGHGFCQFEVASSIPDGRGLCYFLRFRLLDLSESGSRPVEGPPPLSVSWCTSSSCSGFGFLRSDESLAQEVVELG